MRSGSCSGGFRRYGEPPADDVDSLNEDDQGEEVWNFNKLSIQTRHGPTALQQLQAFRSNTVKTIPKTISDAQELFARGLAAITENSLLSTGLRSGTDTFASERKSLEKEVKALNDEIAASSVKGAALAAAVERGRLLENVRGHLNEDG